MCNKDIANVLNITERTVKFHISSMLRKCKVSNRSELISHNRGIDEISERLFVVPIRDSAAS